MNKIQSIALTIAIIGAFNWGVFAFTGFDMVAQLAGGAEQLFARILYIVIAIAGLITISLFFDEMRIRKEGKTPRAKVKVI